MTGATGYVGGATALALRNAGHEVTALVRPDSEARHLRDAGVILVTGDLSTLPTLSDALPGHDVYLHAAQSRENTADLDASTIDTFAAQNGHVIYTSGVWVLGNTEHANEETQVHPLALVTWRPAIEERAIGAGGAVVRPGCVYGGKQSLFEQWFAAAELKQPLKIVGEGNNRWALIELHDLANCFVRVAEQRARGIFHAIDDSHHTLNECARAVAPDGAIEHVRMDGPFAEALMVDQRIDSRMTRQKLGWTPRHTFVGSIDEQWAEWRSAQKVE